MFINDLKKLALDFPEVDGLCFWWQDGAWLDAAGDAMDAEELPYYAEGLLSEGFNLAWQVLGQGKTVAALRVLCWQGARPQDPVTAWEILGEGQSDA